MSPLLVSFLHFLLDYAFAATMFAVGYWYHVLSTRNACKVSHAYDVRYLNTLLDQNTPEDWRRLRGDRGKR